ncbi:MAG: Hint domain-containing protein [Pseudomonadota bacterium]
MLPSPSARPAAPARASAFVIETAALRPDGSRVIAQTRVPTIPLFETAFAALGRGTVLEGRDGPIAIEDLQPGDALRTSDGDDAQVTWIGASTFVPADAGRRLPLVRIMADTFGVARPGGFLTLGPAARILQTPPRLAGSAAGQRLLTPAREFVDGMNVIEISPPTPIRLFHLCLSRHAAVIADGMEVETFHPGSGPLRTAPQKIQELFISLFPRIDHIGDFGPLAHPRAPEASDSAA